MTIHAQERVSMEAQGFIAVSFHDDVSSLGNPLVYPSPIKQERIDLFITKGIDPEVAAIDLEMVKMKLAEEDEGLGWSADQCEDGELAYKRYLHLCKTHGKGVVPTKVMDLFWHYHILDTRSYCEMCERIFDGYLHHYPYFGMRGEEDAKDLEAAFMETKQLYRQSFGESLDQKALIVGVTVKAGAGTPAKAECM